MPGILDRAEQMLSALELTRKYGKEVEDKQLGTKAKALLPTLEKAQSLDDYHAFNEELRKWIDANS